MHAAFTDGWWEGQLAEYRAVPIKSLIRFRATKQGGILALKWFTPNQRERVESNLKLVPRLFDGHPLKVLDVGCGMVGHGAACRWLGHQAVGTDLPQGKFSPIAKYMRIPIFDYAIGQDERLPFADNCFDVVLCICVLIQKEPGFRRLIPGAMLELARVTKHGGQILAGWWKDNGTQHWLPEFLPKGCTETTVKRDYSDDHEYTFKLLTKDET